MADNQKDGEKKRGLIGRISGALKRKLSPQAEKEAAELFGNGKKGPDSQEMRREAFDYKYSIMNELGVKKWEQVPSELQELYLTELPKVQKAVEEGTLQELIKPTQEPQEPTEPVEEESPLGRTPSELSEIEKGRLEFMATGIGVQTEQGIVGKAVDRVLGGDKPIYPTLEMDKRVYEKQKQRTDNLIRKARDFGIESGLIALILPESVETIEKDEEQYIRDNTKEYPHPLKQTEQEQTEIDKKGLRYSLEKRKKELAEPPAVSEQVEPPQEPAKPSYLEEQALPPIKEEQVEQETPSSEELGVDLEESMTDIYRAAKKGGASDQDIQASLKRMEGRVNSLVFSLVQNSFNELVRTSQSHKDLVKRVRERVSQEQINTAVDQYFLLHPEALAQGLTEEGVEALIDAHYKGADTKDHGVPPGYLKQLEEELDKKVEERIKTTAADLSDQVNKNRDILREKLGEQIAKKSEELKKHVETESYQQEVADKVPPHMLPIKDKDVETVLAYKGAIQTLDGYVENLQKRVAQLEAKPGSYTVTPVQPTIPVTPETPSTISQGLAEVGDILNDLGYQPGEEQ